MSSILGSLLFISTRVDSFFIPNSWSAGIDWGRYYILNSGFIYKQTEFSKLTWQSNLIDYGSVDVLPNIYFAIINLITGTITFPFDYQFHFINPWLGTVFLPILIIYWYSFLCKKEQKVIDYPDLFLISLFSMFPLGSVLSVLSGNTNGSGMSRIIFLLILILLIITFDEEKKNPERVFILMMLFFVLFLSYHTWSYYLVIYLSVISILTFSNKNYRYMTSLCAFGIIVFLAFYIYYSTQNFNKTIYIVKHIPNILDNFISLSKTSLINPTYINIYSGSRIYIYARILNAILIFALCIAYLYVNRIHMRKNSTSYDKMLFYMFLSQIFVGFGLFIWDGFMGFYSRIFECAVYLSMLLSAFLLIKCTGKLKNFIRLILLCAVFLSITTYLHYVEPVGSYEEYKGIQFTGIHVPPTSYIFSDFRGTSLIYFNQSGIVTIDSVNNDPQFTNEVLEKCFYNVSDPEVILDQKMGSRYYFFASSSQSQKGLMDPSLIALNPASRDFQYKWSNLKKFNKLYSSRYFDLYNRV
ncbi:MAG: hypothetical protein QM426_04195 [Euryarchaeota archaeon]|nr:hypothetical protein [Euryarchaeota archaeon]